MALATMGVSYPALTPMPIKLLWNASASAPIGFYTIDFDGPFDVTDLVAVDAPEPLATFMAERGYLPKGVPLLKRILGVSGQTVCRSDLSVTIDGLEMGDALPRDRAGRDLPDLAGLPPHPSGEVFLMNWQVRDSLDGRYFGLTSTEQIIGRAVRCGPTRTERPLRMARADAMNTSPSAERRPPMAFPTPPQGSHHASDWSIHAPGHGLRRRSWHVHDLPRCCHRAGRTLRCRERAGLPRCQRR
jgi:conjugative transfer signal peptidase TraF